VLQRPRDVAPLGDPRREDLRSRVGVAVLALDAAEQGRERGGA
jgi:hypothetical protein